MFIPRANYYSPEQKIVIISGAGLSAESGISTFRDSNGLWNNHSVEEVCNIHTWKKNFELVHSFYNERRSEIFEKEPNLAHKTIADISNEYGKDCFVITQNIDNLLEKAGCKEVLHLHGEFNKLSCQACGNKWKIGKEGFNINTDKCPRCSSVNGVKPDIVFFGESVPLYSYLHRAFEYLQNPNSILLIVGTSGEVINFSNLISQHDFFSNEYIKSVKSFNILNNLEANKNFPENLFDEIFYEKASIALPKIKEIIKNKF